MLHLALLFLAAQAYAGPLVMGGRATSLQPSFNVNGTSTVAYVNGGIGYFPYTLAATTTTDSSTTEIFFSTLTIPANMFSRAGQELLIHCRFVFANNADTKTAHIRQNTSGTMTDVGASAGHTGAITTYDNWARLTWISPSLWTNTGQGLSSTSVDTKTPSGTPLGTQSFDETTALKFQCSCKDSSATAGACSFLDMRVEFLGM